MSPMFTVLSKMSIQTTPNYADQVKYAHNFAENIGDCQ